MCEYKMDYVSGDENTICDWIECPDGGCSECEACDYLGFFKYDEAEETIKKWNEGE